MIYEKKPCEICGKLIANWPVAQMMHAKKHEQKHEKPEIATENAEIKNATSDPVPPIQPDVELEITKVADPELKKRMEMALEAQKRFAKAPQVFVASQTSNEMLELRKIYLPESLGPHPTKHAYFGEEKDINRDIARGYMPVIDPVTHQQVLFNEMLFYWCPIEMHLAREKRDQDASRERMTRAAELKNVSSRSNTVGGDAVSVSKLRVEEYLREQQQTA